MSRSWKEHRYLSKEAYMPQYKGMPGTRCRSGWLGEWAGGYWGLFGWHWKYKWWKYIITFWKKMNMNERLCSYNLQKNSRGSVDVTSGNWFPSSQKTQDKVMYLGKRLICFMIWNVESQDRANSGCQGLVKSDPRVHSRRLPGDCRRQSRDSKLLLKHPWYAHWPGLPQWGPILNVGIGMCLIHVNAYVALPKDMLFFYTDWVFRRQITQAGGEKVF